MRKVCLMAIANDHLTALVPRLPPNIVAVGQREMFDRSITILRLEGDGLPDWCSEPAHGGQYVWATAVIGSDGQVAIVPIGQIQPAMTGWYERLTEQYGHHN